MKQKTVLRGVCGILFLCLLAGAGLWYYVQTSAFMQTAGEQAGRLAASALEISKKMKEFTVVVTAKGGGAGRLFGSITNNEVAEALAQQQGIQLDKRKIVLDEPIKQTGLYTVKCKLGYEINADLKVEVKEA